MADIQYDVLIAYQTSGSIHADLDKAHASAGHLGKVMGEVSNYASETAGSLVEGFQHAVEHAGQLAMHAAKIGLALGIGGAAYGVAHLNAHLEQTQIGLAAVFKAVGFESDFNKAFDMATDQVSKMKQEIKALPGDLGNLSDIMMTIASPAGKAGASADQIRKLSGQALLAGTILNLPVDTIGRELGMIIGGTITHRMPLLQRMPGLPEGAELRAMTPAQRLKVMQEAMNNLTADAAGKFSHSWAAVWTTFKDDIKYGFAAPATLPLFDAVKKSLADSHAWFEKNQQRVQKFAHDLGEGLARAWERGTELAQEWWPSIVQFAKDLRHELEVIWERFGPAIKDAAEALKGALGDGTAVKEIGKILELYGASKVGSAIASNAGGALRTGAAVAQLGAAVGPVELGAAAAGGAVALVALTAGALGAAGELHALADSTSKEHEEAKLAASELSRAWSDLVKQFDVSILPSLDKFGVVLTRFAAWAIQDQAGGKGGWLDTLSQFVDPSKKDDTPTLHIDSEDLDRVSHDLSVANTFATKLDDIGPSIGAHMFHAISTAHAATKAEIDAAHKKGVVAGRGSTHVQKVEIVVNTNQDANRVAEMVVHKITTINRHPKVSGHVPNFSGGF